MVTKEIVVKSDSGLKSKAAAIFIINLRRINLVYG